MQGRAYTQPCLPNLCIVSLKAILKWNAGNPRVTPEVTRDVCLLARMMAANLYFSQIEDLMFEVSGNCFHSPNYTFSSLDLLLFSIASGISDMLFIAFLFPYFLGSCQCGGVVMNFVLTLMNFIGHQREMQSIILVCIITQNSISNFYLTPFTYFRVALCFNLSCFHTTFDNL